MSRRRQGARLRKYSLSPERESRRVITTSWNATGSVPSSFEKCNETSATFTARRAVLLADECQERGLRARALCLIADITAADEKPDPAAEAAYGEAGTLARELGMRPLVAESQLGRGRLHRRMGDRALAREHLAAAAALFETMDMPSRLAAVRVELSATG